MAGNILSADVGFPDLGGDKSTEEKLKAVESYLYMLLENLRYTLNNLGVENFNDHELKLMSQTLTEPVELRLQDAEGNLAQIRLDAQELSSKVENVEGDYSRVQQTVNGISTTVGQQGQAITTITQNIQGLQVRTVDGVSGLTGRALFFYDPDHSNWICGRIEMVQDNVNGKYSMQIKTWPDWGLGEGYSIKLDASANVSVTGDEVWIISKKKASHLEGGGAVNTMNEGLSGNLTLMPAAGKKVSISDGSGWWEFRSDGIYRNNVKIVSV